MPKIKCCWKRTAECRRAQRRQSVHQQRRTRWVVIASHSHALQNLQRYDRVQRAHWQNDGKIFPAFALTQKFEKIDWPRQVYAQSNKRRRRRQMISMERPQKRNKNYAREYAKQTARHPERQPYP